MHFLLAFRSQRTSRRVVPDSKFILPDRVLSYAKITHTIVCESARRSVRRTWVRLSCMSNWGADGVSASLVCTSALAVCPTTFQVWMDPPFPGTEFSGRCPRSPLGQTGTQCTLCRGLRSPGVSPQSAVSDLRAASDPGLGEVPQVTVVEAEDSCGHARSVSFL